MDKDFKGSGKSTKSGESGSGHIRDRIPENTRMLLLYVVFPALCVILLILIYFFFQAKRSEVAYVPLTENVNNFNTPGSAAQTEEAEAAATATPTPIPVTPEKVAEEFYNWYMNYQGDPISTKAYATNPLLTEYFINLIAELTTDYNESDPFDPVFCEVNKTREIFIDVPKLSNNNKQADVMINRKSDNKDLYRIVLVNPENRWLIKDIMCQT